MAVNSKNFIRFVREVYGTSNEIYLHEPQFKGNEKNYLNDTIDSTFVSSIGEFVNLFERKLADFTGAKHVVATVNGTSALHISLLLAGVEKGSEVLSQSLTFVGTCNAVRYCGANPIFIDIDKNTLGLSADCLLEFLKENTEIRNDGHCWNIKSNKKISACLPVHTFGFPSEIEKISSICKKYNINVVEDAAESLGSFYKGQHTGVFGLLAAISFNGNKIITTGGGGAILTNNRKIAQRARHITTTARTKTQWSFEHDEVGYNYRLPNINAALGLAQMENLKEFIKKKRILAKRYQEWGKENGLPFFKETSLSHANYWLNVMLTSGKKEKKSLIKDTFLNKIYTRPAWKPLHKQKIYENCQSSDLSNTNDLYDCILTVPSSPI